MARDEAYLSVNDVSPTEAVRERPSRVDQSWNFLDAAPLEQRPLLRRHETTRAYVVIIGIALDLLAVWAALVFVA
jgi:hypothetical protein